MSAEASHETETMTKSGRSAASASSSVRQVGTPHVAVAASPFSAVRATTPVTRNVSGNSRAGLRKKGARQP